MSDPSLSRQIMLRSVKIKVKILAISIVSAVSSVFFFFLIILKHVCAAPSVNVCFVKSEVIVRVNLTVAVVSGTQAIAAVATRAVCIDVCEAVGIDLRFSVRVDLDRIDRAGNDECSY